MFKHVSPENEEKAAGGERGGSQQFLLVTLLVLVALFGYLYFFTGLLKPREEVAKPPADQSVVVKKPIPPRPVPSSGEKAPLPGTSGENRLSQGKEVKPAAGGESPKAKAAVQPKAASSPAAAKSEPATVARGTEPSGNKGEAKPASATTVPAKSPAKEEAQPVTTAHSAKSPATKEAKQGKVPQKVAKPVGKGAVGAYTLLVGDYADEEVKKIQAKLTKAAVTPVHKERGKVAEPMHRLYLAEYADHDAAQAELEKLNKLTSDAFILQENGKYVVYAGSYFREGRAAKEQDRLYDRGVKLLLKKAEVKVPITRVTAGRYSSREEALKAALQLKKLGIKAKVTGSN